MSQAQQLAEITRLANAIWGAQVVGQIIIGRGCVRVFAVTGNRSLFEREHPQAFELACQALKVRAGEGTEAPPSKERARRAPPRRTRATSRT